MPAKRKTTKRATSKKTTAKRTTAKRTTAKKTTARKTTRKATTRKTTAKKATKKTTARKTTAKKTATKKAAPKKLTTVKKQMTKSELMTAIAERVGISKKEVGEVFSTFSEVVHCHLKNGSCGKIKIAGLINAKVVKKPARKARKGINPFTGEEIMIKAKPAYKTVKVSALKALKEMAG